MSDLPERLLEQAAANQKAMAYRLANQRAVRAAQVPPRKRPDEPSEQAAKRKPVVVDDQDNFRFYFASTLINASPEVVDGESVNALQQLKADYQRLVAEFGDGWSTGVIQLSQTNPYLLSAGAGLGYRVARLDQLSPQEFPELLEDPWPSLELKLDDGLILRYGTRLDANTQAGQGNLLDGFSSELSELPNDNNNVVLALPLYDYQYFDVDQWPYQGGFPQALYFDNPDGGDELITLIVYPIFEQFPCNPFDDTEPGVCAFNPTIGLFRRKGWYFAGDGNPYYNNFSTVFWGTELEPPPPRKVTINLGPIDGGTTTEYLLPYVRSLDEQIVNVGASPLIQTFWQKALTACREASEAGMVVVMYNGFDGVASYVDTYDKDDRHFGQFPYQDSRGRRQSANRFATDLLLDGVRCIDFSTSLRRNTRYSNASLLEWLEAQHPVALELEELVDDDAGFFTVCSHRWCLGEGLGYGGMSPQERTPYEALYSFLGAMRYSATLSYKPGGLTDLGSDISAFSAEQQDKLRDIHRVRRLLSRRIVRQYLGPQALAYAQDPTQFGTFPGQLQLG